MDKFCEDYIHNEVCQYGAIPPHTGRCNDKDTLDDIRPQGEWKLADKVNLKFIYKCSKCDRRVSVFTDSELTNIYPFCHCGAKMQKGR